MEQTKEPSSFSSSSMINEAEKEILSFSTAMSWSLYQGFWCPTISLHGVISFQKYFQAQDADIIVASIPKSGTTWLKAITFSIVNRTHYTPSNTPLLTSNPHNLVPFIDIDLFADNPHPDLTIFSSPRIFSTHVPFSSIAESIKQSKCRIVYICRNPFDAAVSLWHHYDEISKNVPDLNINIPPMEEFVDMYFKGVSAFGPSWDNMMGYWKESLENPNKVLFLKYEDMKEDIVSCLKKIAQFIGYPFSEEEERDGVIEEIAKLCSLSNLKNLEVNKKGKCISKFPNKDFFRKGEVGKWVDHINPSKKQHLENVMHENLSGSGLSFKLSL